MCYTLSDMSNSNMLIRVGIQEILEKDVDIDSLFKELNITSNSLLTIEHLEIDLDIAYKYKLI